MRFFCGNILLLTLFLIAVDQLQAQEGINSVNNFLKGVQGEIHPQLLWYTGTSRDSVKNLDSGFLQNKSSDWKCSITASPAKEKGAMDVTALFKLVKGTESSAAVSVSFDFNKWSTENYVLVPAIVYNGNRYHAIGNQYGPPYTRDMFYNPDLPLTISNNPRLSLSKEEQSFLEIQTGNASTPAFCFYSPSLGKGFILLTEQETRFGNSGINIEENKDRTKATVQFTAPSVRKQAAEFGYFFPSGDEAANWKAGDELTLRFKLYTFSAKSIPDLLTRFMVERKSLSGPNHPRNLVPMSKYMELATGICSDNWVTPPVGGFYAPSNNEDFALGWVSGMTNTYPMLALNDEKERGRVVSEIDFVVKKLQGKSGYFYGGITSDGKIYSDKVTAGVPQIHAMVRKDGDALFWMVKHFMLLKEQGYGSLIKPGWEESIKKLAQAFVSTWEKYGQFGQYVDPETGEISVFNSTAGAIVPAGLVLASDYYKDKKFLQVAIDAANYYYNRDVVKQGLTGGACADISQDADSETCFAFLESFMALYYATADCRWLEKAKIQAALGSTWVLSYDAKFPSESQIAQLKSNMAGAVWASIQNKHAAPGICTASGDYLFKLYRATGNRLYADLIRDIQHAHTEAVDMPNHRTTNYGFGTSMERIQPTDAGGKKNIGNYGYTRNSWCETDGTLMALEIPGIYLQTDKNELYVFDHVEAKVVSRDKGKVTLSVSNKTPYDANVSVLAETSRQAKVPLDYQAFTKWIKVEVKSGETKIVTLKSDQKKD